MLQRVRHHTAETLCVLGVLAGLGVVIQGFLIAHDQAGWIGVVVGLLVLPVLPVLTPLYAGVALDSWRILLVDWVACLGCFAIARLVEPKSG